MSDKTAQSGPATETEINTADRFRKAILMAAIAIGIGWAAGLC